MAVHKGALDAFDSGVASNRKSSDGMSIFVHGLTADLRSVDPRSILRTDRPALARNSRLSFLHDFHEAIGIEDLELPVRERAPEFLPADHLDPIVAPFCKLNAVRALDAAWPESFLLCLLDRGLDAHGFHDQSDPSGRGPTTSRARMYMRVAI